MSLPIATQTAHVKPKFDRHGLGEVVFNFFADGDEERTAYGRRMGEFHHLLESRPCPRCGCNRAEAHGLSEPGVVEISCAACDREIYVG